jgi:putative FmdB family regulatory protein
MPLYEYQCENCGDRFERIRKFSDPPLDEPCPKCGGPIRKLLSSPAIQFKGKGWYVTDYAKSGSSEASKSDSASSTTPTGETKTESKTETKSEPAKASTPTTTTPASEKK